MIDELLGRAELKDRIAQLEEERDSLEAQLDAESERRREAVRDRQEAEERVNRLDDRITELEDRLERAESDTDSVRFRGRETCGPARTAELLDRLASVTTDAEGALSAMIADDVPEPVTEAFGDRVGLVRRAAPALVYTDDAGLVSVALRPPIAPEPFYDWNDAFRIDRSWFEPTGRVLFALVRSDSFVAGVYDGDDRTKLDRFTTDVTAEHDKGGFSQARFERRREEEIAAHVDRADERLTELRETHDPEQTILVGETAVVAELAEHADRTAPADATGDHADALDRAFRDFWTTQLFLI